MAPGIRLCTLAEVIEHLGADGQTGIIDGTEIRVRRPAAGHKDRDKFVSGKTKQNAVKAMVLTDAEGRLLYCSPVRPGSCADITQARQLGLVQLLADGPSDGWSHHHTASSRRTLPPGTKSGTNSSARRTPHGASASSMASRT
ncbi:transposase family protein [Streptomyces sp. NPDC046832]|uniref:transposase family protein n=1 Tax=Streptomyces sp. NPDC046832 TaxID=3155020 RepID=UPI0033CC7322